MINFPYIERVKSPHFLIFLLLIYIVSPKAIFVDGGYFDTLNAKDIDFDVIDLKSNSSVVKSILKSSIFMFPPITPDDFRYQVKYQFIVAQTQRGLENLLKIAPNRTLGPELHENFITQNRSLRNVLNELGSSRYYCVYSSNELSLVEELSYEGQNEWYKQKFLMSRYSEGYPDLLWKCHWIFLNRPSNELVKKFKRNFKLVDLPLIDFCVDINRLYAAIYVRVSKELYDCRFVGISDQELCEVFDRFDTLVSCKNQRTVFMLYLSTLPDKNECTKLIPKLLQG